MSVDPITVGTVTEEAVSLINHELIVIKTMNHSLGFKEKLSMLSLGMAGEAGEVIELVKKHLYHGRSLDIDDMEKELGDVLWYVHALILTLGLNLPQVLAANTDKLRARYPGGFENGGGIR